LTGANPFDTIGRFAAGGGRARIELKELVMYAVIETGGKQYRAAEKDTLRVEKLEAEVGDEITLDKVLMVSTDSGVKVGAPYVEGAAVTAKVVRQGKGKKIEGMTFKAKKNERKRFGHRQLFTELVVQSISG
jgi:large subunit ribosomal protein L21